MKREIIAAGLLLLLLLASILNIAYLDALIDRVEAEIDTAEICRKDEEYQQAIAALNRAQQIWDDARSYTHIFIRHPEIDTVADAFHALESDLRDENARAAEASLRLLRYHLECIRDMEHIRIGSILSLISCRSGASSVPP